MLKAINAAKAHAAKIVFVFETAFEELNTVVSIFIFFLNDYGTKVFYATEVVKRNSAIDKYFKVIYAKTVSFFKNRVAEFAFFANCFYIFTDNCNY